MASLDPDNKAWGSLKCTRLDYCSEGGGTWESLSVVLVCGSIGHPPGMVMARMEAFPRQHSLTGWGSHGITGRQIQVFLIKISLFHTTEICLKMCPPLTIFSVEKDFLSTVRYLTFIISCNLLLIFNLIVSRTICSNAFETQFTFSQYIISSLTYCKRKTENI